MAPKGFRLKSFPSVGGNEAGNALLGAISLVGLGAGAYLTVGHVYLAQYLQPEYQRLAVLAAAVIAVFLVGCAAHLTLIGAKSAGKARKDLRADADVLAQLFEISSERIIRIESELARHARGLSPRGYDCLSMARRLTRALELRAQGAQQLLRTSNMADVIAAEQLLSSKLVVLDTCMTSLIGSEPLAPVAPEDLKQLLYTLFTEIKREQRRFAERRECYLAA